MTFLYIRSTRIPLGNWHGTLGVALRGKGTSVLTEPYLRARTFPFTFIFTFLQRAICLSGRAALAYCTARAMGLGIGVTETKRRHGQWRWEDLQARR